MVTHPNAGAQVQSLARELDPHTQLRPGPANKYFFKNSEKKILSLILVDSQSADVRWKRAGHMPVCGHASAWSTVLRKPHLYLLVPGNSSQPLSFPGKTGELGFPYESGTPQSAGRGMLGMNHNSVQGGEWCSVGEVGGGLRRCSLSMI